MARLLPHPHSFKVNKTGNTRINLTKRCVHVTIVKSKGKGLPRQAEVAQGVPVSLRPRISWHFGTTRVVGRQRNAPAAFTPGGIPGTHFQTESTSGHMVLLGVPRKKSPVTPPVIDTGIFRLVAQCLNHYATPGPT